VNSVLRMLILKEITELRRDRRVILFSIVMPVFLFPAMMSLSSKMEEDREERLEASEVKIAVIGDVEEARERIAAIDRVQLVESVHPDSLEAAVRTGDIDLGVDLRAGWELDEEGEAPIWLLYYHASRESSDEAHDRIRDALVALREAERERRYESAGGVGNLGDDLHYDSVDVATESESAGASAGRMLVYLLLFTLYSGGAALATDMVAGEKERGTLETLFLCPVDRSLIARAKLIVVTLGTVLTGVLMILSVSFSYRMGWIAGAENAESLSPLALVQIALLIVPLAVLIGGILLAISSYAKSLKEAQYYFMPVMFLIFIPALLSMSQAVQLNYLVALIPVANVGFAMRDVMLGSMQPQLLLVVVGSTLAWGALVLKAVSTLLSKESTVLGFDPEPVFGRTRGGRLRALNLSMGLSLLAFFYVGQFIQARWEIWGILFTFYALLPALIIFVYRFAGSGEQISQLFSLRLPSPRWWLISVLFGVGMMLPLAGGLWQLQSRFLPAPELIPLGSLEDIAVWQLFLLLAVSPAIVEELLFRGACLGLFRRHAGVATAIFLSSLYFALIHLSVFRIAPTLILGVCFAFFVVRSGSIFPAMLCHLVYNGGLLLGASWAEDHELPLDPTGASAWLASIALLVVAITLATRGRSAAHDAGG